MLHGAAHDDAPPAGVAAIARHGDNNCRLTLPRTACFAVLPLRVIHTTCSRRERVTLPIHSLLISNSAVLSFSVSLTHSLSYYVETSLFVCGPSNAEVALCLTLWRQGVINASCFCPPLGSISVLRPGATSAYYTYSPIFGGLPQAQRGKRNVRGVKFLSRKSSRSKFQFHQR